MTSWIASHFWWIDAAIGGAIVAGVAVLRRRRSVSAFTVRLFGLGCAVGLLWEVPLSTLDGLGLVRIFEFLSPPPYPFLFIIASHTLWDGGLFLAGVALVNVITRSPRFVRFSARELGVLVVWGQLQELGIELLATGTAGWTYVPAAWNPRLVAFHGHAITWVPQLMWLAGSVVFYAGALAIRARTGSSEPSAA